MKLSFKKFLSLFLCIFLLVGVVSCAPEPEKSYEELKALYDGIISEYIALITAKYNGEELIAPDTANMDSRESAIADALYGIVDSCYKNEAAQLMGYGYKDLDSNGTPELILLSRYTSIHAIFTISEGLPTLLEAALDIENPFYFAKDNRFLLRRGNESDTTEEVIYYICHVEDGKMVYDEIYGQSRNKENTKEIESFRYVNGERVTIDDETFEALYREHRKSTRTGYLTVSKLEAPRIILPLVESATDDSLPIADFSSYAAIRKTYLEIANCLDEFKSSEFERGEYDNLFAFPTDTSFEYYIQLLYTAYNGGENMGYDEIDLNGDGQDELVLLKENYEIKAIFTQEEGVPKLLDAFVDLGHFAWLDEDGLIHADHISYSELEYSLYEYTRDGEYKQHYSIIVDNYGRYITKDGKIEPFPYEESMELYYNEYCRYKAPFDPNEHTRIVSELTYTPLIEATDEVTTSAIEKTWHKYADLERVSDKMFARSNTYVTFDNFCDTQVDMKVKYKFTFDYPDPERENYLLSDTTESTLNFTVRKEDGRFVFDENGMKGIVEFGQNYLWIIVEESSDERFPVGQYCHNEYSPAYK